ncbi:type I-E CRISPR-associated protein Cas6/Cse3/CasE [Streptomyces sp. NBC_01237]|uniref:type I-E CRISPR-associated protein Cas6/Cse3/CasE n=1 Tax=Streptomyces sp. NBC_01237 TaxID=2903790 RepID=UPI003FA3B357
MSSSRPDGLATPRTPGWETRPYAPVLNALRPGLRLQFRLAANPTRAAFHRGRRGVRTAATTPAQQIQWLLDRAPRAGRGWHGGSTRPVTSGISGS